MQILLDECVPKPLKRELIDYEVRTVVEMGWAGKKNGELLRLMNEVFGQSVAVGLLTFRTGRI